MQVQSSRLNKIAMNFELLTLNYVPQLQIEVTRNFFFLFWGGWGRGGSGLQAMYFNKPGTQQ